MAFLAPDTFVMMADARWATWGGAGLSHTGGREAGGGHGMLPKQGQQLASAAADPQRVHPQPPSMPLPSLPSPAHPCSQAQACRPAGDGRPCGGAGRGGAPCGGRAPPPEGGWEGMAREGMVSRHEAALALAIPPVPPALPSHASGTSTKAQHVAQLCLHKPSCMCNSQQLRLACTHQRSGLSPQCRRANVAALAPVLFRPIRTWVRAEATRRKA